MVESVAAGQPAPPSSADDHRGVANYEAVLARVSEERAPAPVLRLRVWGAEMWRERRGRLSAAAGLAVAASLAAIAILSPLPGNSRRGPLLADARNAAAIVEEVDFENHEGAVLQSGDTTVIWIDDDTPAVPQ